MYNHNKAQQSKNRVYISWDILYVSRGMTFQQNIIKCIVTVTYKYCQPSDQFQLKAKSRWHIEADTKWMPVSDCIFTNFLV